MMMMENKLEKQNRSLKRQLFYTALLLSLSFSLCIYVFFLIPLILFSTFFPFLLNMFSFTFPQENLISRKASSSRITFHFSQFPLRNSIPLVLRKDSEENYYTHVNIAGRDRKYYDNLV